MAVTNFTGTQLIPFIYGREDHLTNVLQSRYRAGGTELRFVFTGTDAALTFGAVSSATPFTYTLDGVLQADPSFVVNTPTTFATGLADTAHTAIFRLKIANQGTGVLHTLANTCLTITGAAPAVAADPNFGPYRIGLTGYGVCSTFSTDSTANAAMQPDLCNTSYYQTPPNVSGAFGASSIRARGRADQVWGFINTQNGARFYALEKDGVVISRQSVTNNGFIWTRIGGTGLDDGSEHDWAIVYGSNANAGSGGVDAIMLGGTVGAFSTTHPTRRRIILWIGDSITASTDGGGGVGVSTQGDATLAFPYLASRLAGADAIVAGQPGTTWAQQAIQAPVILRQAARCGQQPDKIVITLGRNDTVQATVRTQSALLINNLLGVTDWTGKIVIQLPPLVGGWLGSAVVAGIQQGIADVGSSRVITVDGSGWTDITAVSDNTHFDIAGHLLDAQRLYASGALAATSSGGGGGGTGGAAAGTALPGRSGGYWFGKRIAALSRR